MREDQALPLDLVAPPRIPDDAPDQAQMALYATWTPTRRWERAVQLRAAAWELKTAFCRQEHPEWSDDEIRADVARQFLHARG